MPTNHVYQPCLPTVSTNHVNQTCLPSVYQPYLLTMSPNHVNQTCPLTMTTNHVHHLCQPTSDDYAPRFLHRLCSCSSAPPFSRSAPATTITFPPDSVGHLRRPSVHHLDEFLQSIKLLLLNPFRPDALPKRLAFHSQPHSLFDILLNAPFLRLL